LAFLHPCSLFHSNAMDAIRGETARASHASFVAVVRPPPQN
jgi:hypothetical protein